MLDEPFCYACGGEIDAEQNRLCYVCYFQQIAEAHQALSRLLAVIHRAITLKECGQRELWSHFQKVDVALERFSEFRGTDLYLEDALYSETPPNFPRAYCLLAGAISSVFKLRIPEDTPRVQRIQPLLFKDEPDEKCELPWSNLYPS